MYNNKEYTTWRKTLAWLGFATLAIAIIWGVYALVTFKRVIVIVNDYNASLEAKFSPIATALEVAGEITAYTSDPAETDDTPEITAANIKVRPGIVANNCYEFGTKVVIRGITYEIWDRMNRRYGCQHFDIWHEDKAEALEFGRQFERVLIINNHDN